MNFLTLLQGFSKWKDRNQKHLENAHGLIAKLDLNHNEVLIPGDALYGDIYTNLKNPLSPNYVIIPHHACRYNGPIDPTIIKLSSLKESFTFCDEFYNPSYCHPNLTHFLHYMHAPMIRLVDPENKNIVYANKKPIRDLVYSYIKYAKPFYDWDF